MSKQALIFLSHTISGRIFRHFRRIQEETDGQLFALFCLHTPYTTLGTRIEKAISHFWMPTPRVVIDARSSERLMPRRYRDMHRLGRWYNKGFTDLAYLPAMIGNQLRQYEYIWLVENDVDYAGNWHELFSGTADNNADLLTTYVYPRVQNRNWYHWSWFEAPKVPFDQHISSFNAIARFSRRLLSVYLEAVEYENWQGHTEALWPTIARHNGLTICDLGGNGPFCPKRWQNKFYYNPPVEGWDNHEPGRGDMPDLSPRPFWLLGPEQNGMSVTDDTIGAINKITYICAPNVSQRFFHESPSQFCQRNVLYHPVKIAPSRLRRYYQLLKTGLECRSERKRG